MMPIGQLLVNNNRVTVPHYRFYVFNKWTIFVRWITVQLVIIVLITDNIIIYDMEHGRTRCSK